MINIIIADDHPIFIDGIKTVLKDVPDISIIGEAQNGKQVLDLLKYQKVDIILLDIRMPVLDGIETAKIIKKQYSRIKIIILTQFGDKGPLKKCMEMGVDGYLLKDCNKQELIKAIKTIYKGGTYFSIKNKFPKSDNEKINANKLSKRERQVLQMLSQDKTCKQIALELNIKVSTIRTYRNRLMAKAAVNTVAGLIHWADENDLI